MSLTQHITEADKWFIGEDKILEFEALSDDGKEITDSTKGVEDLTGRSLVWWLTRAIETPRGLEPASTPLIEKRTGSGVNLIGIYNASRAINTQRVRVIVDDVDTDALKPGTYFHALKQLVPSADAVLVDGTALLQKAAAPAE